MKNTSDAQNNKSNQDNDSKKPLLCLIAPTASGKTFFAHELVDQAAQKNINLEIISLDSALIYQDMNIGTAKPTATELQNYPYHLVNICRPIDHYDVAHFLRDAEQAIEKIYAKGAIPLIVGGTMMYYKALSEGLNDLPSQHPEIRAVIEKNAEDNGWQSLHDELLKIDPATAAKIQSNDRQRIQRALEIFHITQMPPSVFFAQQRKTMNYQCISYTLNVDRAILHQRIEQRFLQMLEQGLIEEVQFLQQKYPEWQIEHSSMRAVGYRQTCEYLAGQINYQELIDKGSSATRQLAKRQMTWLRQLNAQHLNYNPENIDQDSQQAVLAILLQAVQEVQDLAGKL